MPSLDLLSSHDEVTAGKLDYLNQLRADIPKRPSYWIKEIWGRHAWSRQVELFDAPYRYNRVAVGSGHGVGKTDSSALIPLQWMVSHPQPSYVLIVSASWTNVTGRIFPAMKNWVKATKNPIVRELFSTVAGRLITPSISNTACRFKLGDEWEVIGLSPAAQEVGQGWHASNGTLVLVDEASDLSYPIFESLMSLIKSHLDVIIMFGNPIHQDGPFADILRRRKGFENWHAMHISSEETPNYRATQAAILAGEITEHEALHGKEKIIVPGLQTYSWCRDMEKRGRNSAIFACRVLGIVPDQSENTFIARREILDCALRPVPGPNMHSSNLMLLCDPAWSRTGDDMTIGIYDKLNDALIHVEAHQGMEQPETEERLLKLINDMPINEVRIDSIGYGAGLVQHLTKRQLPSVRIEGVNMSLRAHEQKRFINRRAESWSLMRDGLATLAIKPEDISSFEEVSTLRCFHKGQRLQIESKEDYKARGYPSPNHADLLALVYARLPGDQVFATAGDHLRLKLPPKIWKTPTEPPEVWSLALDHPSYEHTPPRQGTLMRSLWYSRANEAACIWVHVDADRCWTVFDSLVLEGASVPEFVHEVLKRSKSDNQVHRYDIDVMAAPVGTTKPGQNHLLISLQDAILDQGGDDAEVPMFKPHNVIKGMTGMEVIDELILGTLARFPDDQYWADTKRDPKAFLDCGMLLAWPVSVIQDLTNARLKCHMSWQADEDEYQPEEAVGGGGPYTRCLRLLATMVI